MITFCYIYSIFTIQKLYNVTMWISYSTIIF